MRTEAGENRATCGTQALLGDNTWLRVEGCGLYRLCVG